MTSVAVVSRSFSKNSVLRNELLKRYQKVKFNDEGKSFEGDALIEFVKDYEMAIVGIEPFNQYVLSQLPQLKVISRFGVGFDTVDVKTMAEKKMRLAITRGANKRAVAELALTLMLNMLRQIPISHQELRAGIWQQRKGRQLTGCTVGVIGMGAIGKDLALLLKAFDCKVLGYDLISQTTDVMQQVDLETLLKNSDIVSLHLPLNDMTHHLLNAERLALMKSNAILINTARGGLVDEQVLKAMLKNNKLAGAAFDVFTHEPPQDQELLSLPNFFSTPHIAGSTEEAILAMGYAAIDGLEQAEIPAVI